MSGESRLSQKKKIRLSAIACSIAVLIAFIADGTLTDKVLWFFEISVFSLFALWTIW